MNGAGFCGYAIAIVESRYVEAVINNIGHSYETGIQIKPVF